MYNRSMNALENNRHELFCLEYLNDMNATQAAVRAGYRQGNGARVMGYRLLNRPDVRERINELMAERAERCEVDADYVLRALKRAAETCLQLVPKYGGDGEVLALVPANATAGLKALELLGRHLAMFVDRTQQTTDDVIELVWSEPINRDGSRQDGAEPAAALEARQD